MFLSQRQSSLTLKGLSTREHTNILGFPHDLRNLSFHLFLIITPMKTWIVNWEQTVASWFKTQWVVDMSSLPDTSATGRRMGKENLVPDCKPFASILGGSGAGRDKPLIHLVKVRTATFPTQHLLFAGTPGILETNTQWCHMGEKWFTRNKRIFPRIPTHRLGRLFWRTISFPNEFLTYLPLLKRVSLLKPSPFSGSLRFLRGRWIKRQCWHLGPGFTPSTFMT